MMKFVLDMEEIIVEGKGENAGHLFSFSPQCVQKPSSEESFGKEAKILITDRLNCHRYVQLVVQHTNNINLLMILKNKSFITEKTIWS